MRFTTTILLASFLIGTAACASSGSGTGGSVEANEPQGPGGQNGTGAAPEPEKPLTAKAVCATVETDTNFGEGCSGTGSGQEVCALEDSSCGVNKCVYETRKEGFYDFYCAPRCNTADSSTSCPLGYECVAPTASCAGDAQEGVCTKRIDYGCKDAGDVSGTFLEGLDGALLSIKWTGTQGSLRQKTNTGWRTLTTWADTSSYGSLYGVARSDRRLLIVTSGTEILIDEDGTAKATKRTSTSSYAPSVGVDATGEFVSLETSSGQYATLSKRGADGKWSEVGPTRKRIAALAVLHKGFVARCGEELCTSKDGESFDPIALPGGIAFDETSRFTAAGVSQDDFYLAIDGRLFHFRKGKWVEEGPRGQAPGATGSTSYPDTLRVSSTGTVVFSTYNGSTTYGSSYTTYTAANGSECWKTTSENDMRNATLVGDAFMWTSYGADELCSLKVD